MKGCALCNALARLASIDDAEAERILTTSDMSAWCNVHMRAWVDARTESTRGKAKLESILKRAGRTVL